mmetsp:Transcript_35876/g.115383  ORF Transcript_35876/g.115383 Transcript_35876/m.115383 type:complete len:283 (+) Transcript_35876:1993-2841(+)
MLPQPLPVGEQVPSHRLLPLERRLSKRREKKLLKHVGVFEALDAERSQQRQDRRRRRWREELVGARREEGVPLREQVPPRLERHEAPLHRLVEGHPRQRRRPPRRDKARRAVARPPRLLGRRVRVGGRPVLSHGDGFLADVVLGKEPQERPRPVARELRPLQRSVGSVARAELVDQRRRELVRLSGVSSDVARERLRRGGLVLERRLVDAHEGRVDDRHRQRRHQLVDPWARRSGLRIRRLRCLRCPVTRRPVQLELQQRRRQRERARQLSDCDNLPGAEGQ